MKSQSGRKTLLLSVLMSAPGPLVVGLGLLAGRSSTQLADFVRRSAELLALIVSYCTYRSTTQAMPLEKIAVRERRSNAFVGAMMILGGGIMLALAVVGNSQEKGNVIPGLMIALLGVIANTLFWQKYARLNRQTPNAIIAVQSRLYRAKALVDGCVVAALAAVHFFPKSSLAHWLDGIGSAVVAVYLCWCGVRTLLESSRKPKQK